MPRYGHIADVFLNNIYSRLAETLPRQITDITKTATAKQLDLTWTAEASLSAWQPSSGKKLRLKFISLELSADVTLGFRWTSTGTIYYLRTTKGVYVANLIGANVQGGVDEALYLYASGAASVKGFLLGEEV